MSFEVEHMSMYVSNLQDNWPANILVTRLKVVCAGKGGCNAKYLSMQNQTRKEKFSESFSLKHQAVQEECWLRDLVTDIQMDRG